MPFIDRDQNRKLTSTVTFEFLAQGDHLKYVSVEVIMIFSIFYQDNVLSMNASLPYGLPKAR